MLCYLLNDVLETGERCRLPPGDPDLVNAARKFFQFRLFVFFLEAQSCSSPGIQCEYPAGLVCNPYRCDLPVTAPGVP